VGTVFAEVTGSGGFTILAGAPLVLLGDVVQAVPAPMKKMAVDEEMVRTHDGRSWEA
jgi:hypothetical protein